MQLSSISLEDDAKGSFAAVVDSELGADDDDGDDGAVERSSSFEPLEVESTEDDAADLLRSRSPSSRVRARAAFPILGAVSACIKCRWCGCTQGRARVGPCVLVPALAIFLVTIAAVAVALTITFRGNTPSAYRADSPPLPSAGCSLAVVGPALPGSYAERIIVQGRNVCPCWDRETQRERAPVSQP